MKTRSVAFDLLKLFAIFMVLWGHCIQYMKSTNVDEPVFLFIYSFHMPLFMMISGYFSGSSMTLKFWPLLKKKFVQLLLPCLTWYLLAYVLPKLGLLILHKDGGSFSISSLNVLLHNFWFLKSVFVCYILAYWGAKGKWVGLLLSILASQLIPLFAVGFLYPAFLMGVLLSKRRVIDNTNMRRVIMVTSLVIWAGLLCKMKWIEYNIPINVLLDNPHLFVDRALRILIGIAGSLFWIALFAELFHGSSICQNWTIAKYGKYTLAIYILQTYILEQGLSKIIQLDGFSLLISDFVIAPLISFAVLALCIVLIRLTEQNKYIKFWLWGYK